MYGCKWMLGALVALVLGGAPRADAAPQGPGLALGLRAGFGLPAGLLEGGDGHTDVPMKEVVTGIIPVQLDVGYFVSSRLHVGASFQYARGLLAEPCALGSSCSASGLRFGANVSYHLPLSDTLSPWLGLGVGVDLFEPSQAPSVVDGQTRRVNHVFTGLEYFNVQGGTDFNVGGPVWLGPFATFTMSRYANVNEDAFHFWLIGGLRLQMRL